MTMLETLARRGNAVAAFVLDAYNSDQPRDEKGMWTAGAMAGTHAASTEEHAAAAVAHSLAYKETGKVVHLAAQKAHERAASGPYNDHASRLARSQSKAAVENLRGLRSTRVNIERAKLQAEADIDAALASGKTYESIHGQSSTRSEPIGREAWNKHPFEMSKDPKTLSAIHADEIRERQIARGNDPERGVFRGMQKESTLRTTQIDLPVHRDAPVALMAPHSQLPVGNTKPKEPIHDLKQTQRLPAVQERSTGLNQADVARQRLDEFKRSGAQADLAKAFGVNTEPKRLSGESTSGNSKELTPEEHRIAQAMSSNRSDRAALRSAGMTLEEGLKHAASAREKLGVASGGSLKEAYKKINPKESRRDAAAASAGRWASRALENAAKKPLERTGEREHRAFVAMMQSTKSLRQEGYARRGANLSDKQIKDRTTWLRRQEMKGKK